MSFHPTPTLELTAETLAGRPHDVLHQEVRRLHDTIARANADAVRANAELEQLVHMVTDEYAEFLNRGDRARVHLRDALARLAEENGRTGGSGTALAPSSL